jgi:hypothetical protein
MKTSKALTPISVDRVKQLYQTANLTYAHSLHRATPYLQGVSLGYLLHKTDRNTHIPKVKYFYA